VIGKVIQYMKILEDINNKGTSYFDLDSANGLFYILGICRVSIDSNVINIVSQTADTGAAKATANRDIVVDIGRSGVSGVHSDNELPCVGAISTDIEYSTADTINNNNQIGGKPIDHITIYSCAEIN